LFQKLRKLMEIVGQLSPENQKLLNVWMNNMFKLPKDYVRQFVPNTEEGGFDMGLKKVVDDIRREGERIGKLKGKMEGERIGKLKGKMEGKLEGKLEGERIGELKGKLEGKEEVARQLMNMGLDISSIATATGFTVDKVEQLREQSRSVIHTDTFAVQDPILVDQNPAGMATATWMDPVAAKVEEGKEAAEAAKEALEVEKRAREMAEARIKEVEAAKEALEKEKKAREIVEAKVAAMEREKEWKAAKEALEVEKKARRVAEAKAAAEAKVAMEREKEVKAAKEALEAERRAREIAEARAAEAKVAMGRGKEKEAREAAAAERIAVEKGKQRMIGRVYAYLVHKQSGGKEKEARKAAAAERIAVEKGKQRMIGRVYAYLVHKQSDCVSVIDTDTHEELAAIPVGESPCAGKIYCGFDF
jgi:YVTN family beta-propeller protein